MMVLIKHWTLNVRVDFSFSRCLPNTLMQILCEMGDFKRFLKKHANQLEKRGV